MTGPEDPVGSLGEEAAKLLGALSEWSREQSGDASDPADTADPVDPAGAAGAQARDLWQQLDEHVATGGDDCRFCPVCRMIHAVRRTSPEARQHLADATLSLARTVAAMLETPVPTRRSEAGDAERSPSERGEARPAGVQRIDLDDAPEGPQDDAAGPRD